MKKISVVVLAILIILAMVACRAAPSKVEITAESSLTSLKEINSNITSVNVFDENTDPNENLGRPGQYIGKGDFYDSRMKDSEENAGTVEFFSSKTDCKDRYDYLCKLSDPELGAFGVNQYIYKYDLAIFRVSFDFTPTEAKEYETAMNEIMGEVSTQYGGK